MNVRIIPIKFSWHWSNRWDKEDPIFWHRRSWEACLLTLREHKRVDFYSYIINIGWLRIHLGFFNHDDFEGFSKWTPNQ